MKENKDERDFLLVWFSFSKLFAFSPTENRAILLQLWFFFIAQPQIFTESSGAQAPPQRTGAPAHFSTSHLWQLSTVFKVQGNTNVFQLAWFEEAWPKLFEIFSIHSRLPVCHMLSYHRSADDGSFSTINLQITYSFLLKIISLSKIILLFHHYLL